MDSVIASYFYPMIRSGVNLEDAINTVYINYEGILKKRGIESKEQLKQKLIEYYSAQGVNLDEYVKSISVDKFITLMMRMVIDTPKAETVKDIQEPKEELIAPINYEEESKFGLPVTQYEDLYDFLNKNLKPLLPAERVGYDSWKEQNKDKIRSVLDAVARYMKQETGKGMDDILEEVNYEFEEFIHENWDKFISEEYPA